MAEAVKKLAGKYESPEALEKAYLELEGKLGEQGKTLGELNKLVTEWKPWIEKAAPIVDWYGKTVTPNADRFKAFIESGFGANGPAAAPDASAIRAEAREIAETAPGYEWMTPGEKRKLQQDIAKDLTTQVVEPFKKEFWGQAQNFAKTMADQLQNQHRAFTDVLWRTFEFTMPKEQLERAKAWHAESLKFADPSKIDPMQMGREWMDVRAENESLKTRMKEMEEKSLAREKASVPNLFGGPSPDSVTTTTENAGPMSREDRLRAVMNETTESVGQEAVRDFFPSLA